jgi:hypothetical protein
MVRDLSPAPLSHEVRIYREFNPWPINRPLFYFFRDDLWTIEVAFGNGNSDPVFSMGVTFEPPEWARRIEYERQTRTD